MKHALSDESCGGQRIENKAGALKKLDLALQFDGEDYCFRPATLSFRAHAKAPVGEFSVVATFSLYCSSQTYQRGQ